MIVTPSRDYHRTQIVKPEKLYQGLDAFVHGIAGWGRRRPSIARSLLNEAEKISDMARGLVHLSDHRLRERIEEIKLQFRRQDKDHESLIPEAMAAMVEASHRTTGLLPYTVQVMGALAMYHGYLAEMATGEGKSLTACMPSILAAWTGRPFHFVTVNDYLASRDAAEMAPFYSFCGVSVGCVTSQMEPDERRLNYDKGVVYTTLKELVADFLRDRLIIGALHDGSRRQIRSLLNTKTGPERTVLRGLDTAIVDEADSVLIDEAVTPLIISRPQKNSSLVEACMITHEIVRDLIGGTDYTVDHKYKDIILTKEGERKVEERASLLKGMWRGAARREELVKQALTAREFYKLDQQYVIQDGKVEIVDEFTGRLMPNRTWRHGLHQAIEAKEGLVVNDPSETLARLSFQRFFRFFRKLSGMTGTAHEAAAELWHIYRLPVMKIPTNRPCIRKVLPDKVFSTEQEKFAAVVDEIERWQLTGRPVLVGTRSVTASERLASLLAQRGLEFNLLNAVRHKEEAQIVAMAGEKNRITISTNMAGRGTDIKLGAGVAQLGGLHVIATERHESGRIDRQLFGRCARQGDPGSAQAFMSVEDELIKRFLPAFLKNRLTTALRNGAPGSNMLAKTAVYQAQRTAQRLAYRQRREVLKMDTWLEEALSFSGPSAEV